MKKNVNLENLPKKKKITIKRIRIKFDMKEINWEWSCKQNNWDNPIERKWKKVQKSIFNKLNVKGWN
jgi:hypothetical protein